MIKELIIEELIEAGKAGASVYIIKTNGKVEVTSNYPGAKSAIEMAGHKVLLEIGTSDETNLDEERAIEIIECYDELEEMED